jgi:large subunit ribosomal protein L25
MEFIQIEVREREERGTAAMNRIRRSGGVPAVLYGLQRRNLPLTIPFKELDRFIQGSSHLVELKMGDETRDAILREVQYHPLTDEVLHIDLVRVDKDKKLEDHVSIRYKGTAVGTREGGLFQPLMDTLTVTARPRDLPDEILLDISALHVGDGIYVRDVTLPASVTCDLADDDLIAHVVAVRGLAEDDEASEDGEPGGEPEVIGKETDSEAKGG